MFNNMLHVSFQQKQHGLIVWHFKGAPAAQWVKSWPTDLAEFDPR